jgi:hypothetical protein
MKNHQQFRILHLEVTKLRNLVTPMTQKYLKSAPIKALIFNRTFEVPKVSE